MKYFFRRRACGFVASLFLMVVGSAGRVSTLPSMQVSSDSDITIQFRGLIVFDSSGKGTQVVRLHSKAKHHEVSIQIKGPGFDDFLDWAHEYEEDADLKLEVKLRATPITPSADWTSDERPYKIAKLHPPSEGLGDLVRKKKDRFRPTFTFYAGAFHCDERIPSVTFFRTGDPEITEPNVPKLVIATIHLRDGESAVLSGKGQRTIEIQSGQKWDILVKVNPYLEDVCDEYHFIYYYDGFGLKKNTKESDVPSAKRYRAKTVMAGTGGDLCGSPQAGRVPYDRVLPTRPCIPVTP